MGALGEVKMTRIRKRLPSPAMIVAIIALMASTAGTTWAFGLNALSNKAKDKTVGVGKLTYTTTTISGTGSAIPVSARCPEGLQIIGGGIHTSDPARSDIEDSHPIPGGWSGSVRAITGETIVTEAICARSRKVTGAPTG